jgi:hypothetical protein
MEVLPGCRLPARLLIVALGGYFRVGQQGDPDPFQS